MKTREDGRKLVTYDKVGREKEERERGGRRKEIDK